MLRLQAEQLRVLRSGAEVLSGVSFGVAGGEIYGLLGGNGAGKSTTLAAFLGFVPVAGGRIVVGGRDVGADPAAARRAMAYLPEATSLYEHLDARENLNYFLQLAGMRCSAGEIDQALDRVSLDTRARHLRLRTYSKGMRQKVAIALAILRDTGILLLDEPTSGLDPAAIDEFHALVRGLADAGKAILMVTHDVYGACQVADRIGLLRGGQLVAQFETPPGGRIDTEAVHRAFSPRAGS
jgi:ABC-2 type transport system ATP-binding protein